ncbi:MAG: hypothetical protein JRN52_08505 [Nitrososphaerota archaeon]|nr:hypothetical protein [Nitrososphaerota archaeon]
MEIYKLQPINYEMMEPKRKKDVVSNFVGLVSSLNSPVQMIITKEPVGLQMSPSEVLTSFPARFYLVSDGPIDNNLGAFGYTYSKLRDPPSYSLEFARSKYVVLKDRSFVKGYTVTQLSSFSNVGFITNLLDYVDRIYVSIFPLPRREMKSKVERYKGLLQEKWTLSNKKSEDLSLEIARADSALKGIVDGTEKLFRIRLTFAVKGSTFQELKSRARTFLELILSSSVNEMDSPRGELIQTQLALGRGRFSGADLYIVTRSIPALFPFISAEMVDDSGAFLGINYNTGGPIMYDPFLRSNYNMAIVARTGAGKSMLVKTFVSRFLGKYPDSAVFIIESIVKPEYTRGADGSYEKSFGGATGCNLVDLGSLSGISFDPMLVFKDWSDAFAVITSLGEIAEKDELRMLEPLIRDNIGVPTKVLIDRVPDGNLKADLENLHRKFAFLFEGEPIDLTSKMIFDAHSLPDGIKEKVVSMMFLLVQKVISQMPSKTKKIVVIDEAWAYLGYDRSTGQLTFPAAAKFMERLSRAGRHENVLFIIATQEIGDLMGTRDKPGPGWTMIQQAATKMFMLNQNVSKVLHESLGLSQEETEFLENVKIGHGILVAEGQHYAFYNQVSKRELEQFTTRPSEISY